MVRHRLRDSHRSAVPVSPITTALLKSRDPAAPVYTTEIDDTSSACQYEGNAWSYQPMNPGEYFNSTAHITQNNQDAVTCNFTGTAVEVIGGLMTDHDNYTVRYVCNM